MMLMLMTLAERCNKDDAVDGDGCEDDDEGVDGGVG